MERNKHGVKVGQIWRDNDPRIKEERLLKVTQVEVGLGRAKCDVITQRKKGGKAYVHVRLDRLNGTRRGYSLVKKGEEND